MAPSRTLPSPRNPLLADDQTPPHEILVPRRRLGQTDLSSQTGTVGLNESTKPENLGIFDYAHLRVPLPKDLKGSGIFAVGQNSYPESYFLMRRSTDGFISATGMFKAAFPWASLEDEQNERLYHKTISTVGPQEVAGSVWISPAEALDLAADYGMRRWIVALLDPEKIEKGTKDLKRGNHVSSPPKFDMSEVSSPERATKPPPVNPRKRELRSASPTKQTPRKIATPRKRRTAKQASVDPEQQPEKEKEKEEKKKSSSAAKRASSSTHPLENGVNAPEPAESSPAPAPSTEDVVRITADETVERDNDIETVHTTVKVEMPVGHPDLPLPEDTEEMVRLAQEMVAQAKSIEGGEGRSSSKRKADEAEVDDEEDDERANGALEPSAKRQKIPLSETLKKERVRSRTALGLAATIAIGSAISYFF